MAHFLSVQFRRHPSLRIGEAENSPQSPSKNGLQSNFPFQGDQKKHPHAHPKFLDCTWTICTPPEARWALINSGSARNYFRTEAGEHPSPRVYWEPIWEHHLELDKQTHKAWGSSCGGRAFRRDGTFPESLSNKITELRNKSNKITKLSFVQGKVNTKLFFSIFDLGKLWEVHTLKRHDFEKPHIYFALGNSSAVPVLCWWVLQLLLWCQCPPAQSLLSIGSFGWVAKNAPLTWAKLHLPAARRIYN